jgi:hypothetical protein
VVAVLLQSGVARWESKLNVVIRVTHKDRVRAWRFLVRHSPGTALPNNTFIVFETAVRGLRAEGIEFTEIARVPRY